MTHQWLGMLGMFTLVACAGCGDGGGSAATTGDPTGAGGSTGSGTSTGAGGAGGSGADWQTLITGDWMLDPASEGYVCARKTLEQDYWISGFESIAPVGTHHTILSMGPPNGPDGTSPCSSLQNHPFLLFGSGVGTNPLDFPDGVAMRLTAGQQLNLNLHLFNTAASDVTGQSGTRARVVDPAAVQSEANAIIAGTLSLSLPPNQETVTTAVCTLNSPATLFALQPHMHQLGTHMKVTAQTAGGDTVLHDGPYDFSDQAIYPVLPFSISPGDRIRVECTHDNTTGATVSWGDSSTAEMCHTGVYLYPASSAPYLCMN